MHSAVLDSAGCALRRSTALRRLHSSVLVASRADLPRLPGSPQDKVQLLHGNHDLYLIEKVNGPITSTKEVPAFIIENDVGMRVKAMRQGGNMVSVRKNDIEYVWNNVGGALYYGANQDAFPLRRGLILHGGIRMASVTAEHGLYYDTDWDVSFRASRDGSSKTIVMSIVDSAERRPPPEELSLHQYTLADQPDIPMSKYPVTNMKFTYAITLRAGEEFVRLEMSVENPTAETSWGEAWLPMTYPIEKDSKIISPQRKRWRRDEWCHYHSANIVNFDTDELLHPLWWKGSGIYYDWPYMEGGYHAVNMPSKGRGCAYVTDNTMPHFIKLWSWGEKKYWNPQNVLEQGRPATEYYEPGAAPSTSPSSRRRSLRPSPGPLGQLPSCRLRVVWRMRPSTNCAGMSRPT